MTDSKKAPATARPKAAPKPPKKLVPRHAAEAKVATEAVPAVELTPAAEPVPAVEPAPAAGSAPETTPETTPAPVDATASVAAQPAAATAPPAAAKRAARKPSALDEINARNKKAMVDALAKAQAVKIAQPLGRPLPPPELAKSKKAAKAEKPVKHKKPKLVRDSYAMPEAEYAQIAVLKKRLAGLGQVVKKSELLRGGVAALVALDDTGLLAVIGGVEKIKTGRPAK